MKDEINLLPPAAKAARAARLVRGRLLYVARRVGVVWLVLGIILIGSFVLLRQQRTALQRQLAARQMGSGSRDDRVKSSNAFMSAVARWVASHPPISPLLADVVNAVPAAVRLEVLAMPADGTGVFVKGVTTSRTAVVDMQQRLEALPWVATLEAPLQNFAAGQRSEFSFTLHRKEESHASPTP